MKMPALRAMRNTALCAFLYAFAVQADARIEGAANARVDTETAAQRVVEPGSPCAHPFPGLGLRLDNDRPYRQAALHSEARNSADQAHGCHQQRWQIPANDLTVRLGR
jgi:hypothetical protein